MRELFAVLMCIGAAFYKLLELTLPTYVLVMVCVYFDDQTNVAAIFILVTENVCTIRLMDMIMVTFKKNGRKHI